MWEPEEEDPVPLGTPRRLTMKVVIHQVAYSPSGTRSVLQSASYNFKNAIAGETTIAKYNREEVKRKSKVRAVAKFDPAKREAANAKRRKLAQPEAAPAPALLAWAVGLSGERTSVSGGADHGWFSGRVGEGAWWGVGRVGDAQGSVADTRK